MAKGLLTRNDLPMAAFTKPSWWVSAIYEQVPGRGLLFRGYTPPAWRTFPEHVEATFGTHTVSWVWFINQWVKAA